MLEKMRITLTAIEMIEFVGGHTTGHAIADVIDHVWSRTTTYRRLERARQFGLVEYLTDGFVKQWFITSKGHDFLAEFRELPF